jgi:haloalkane dehalogenase
MPAFLRTPDERFENLPGFSEQGAHEHYKLFSPHYIDILPNLDGLRTHYLDTGKPTEQDRFHANSSVTNYESEPEVTFLCLHGNPSWSYLYRKMIPVLAKQGRVVAPDLLGFGRSDKPLRESWHSFEIHRNMLLAFIHALDLKNITLVVQDWGGIFGLTLPMAMPERFKRLIVMNTALSVGSSPSEGFKQWREFNNTQPDLNIGKMFKRGKADMSEAECAAYNAPYPDATYKAAIRAFPNLVPDHPEAPGAAISREAAKWWANQWRGYSFMAVGVQDPVLGVVPMQALRKIIRGCPEPLLIPEGGHFVQEWGEPIAQAALNYFASMTS